MPSVVVPYAGARPLPWALVSRRWRCWLVWFWRGGSLRREQPVLHAEMGSKYLVAIGVVPATKNNLS